MNLISCKHCAVVLDKDKLEFAKDMYNDDNEICESLASWDDERSCWDVFVDCPVCKGKIFKGDS